MYWWDEYSILIYDKIIIIDWNLKVSKVLFILKNNKFCLNKKINKLSDYFYFC